MKPGYKHTEVGVIPEEWEIFSLSELTEAQRPISYGIVQTGPNLANGVSCLRVVDIHEGQINKSELIKTSKEISDSYRRTILKSGDLVMPLRGKVGDVGLVDEELEGANLTRGVALIAIRAGWSPLFCQQVIAFIPTRRRLEQAMNGSALQEIPIASLRAFRIATPQSLPEQRAIAEALSDVDGLLGGLNRLIAKKRDLKQAAMQQLLTGQTRLPGFHGEWEVKRLGDIASISKGTQLHSSETNHEGHYPHFNGGISPSSFTDKFNTPANTIAISEGGNSCGYVQLVPDPFWCGGHCYAVVPKSTDNRFLYHALKGQQTAIQGLRVGSGLPNVQKTALGDFEFCLPSDKAEQTAIAQILSDMDAELTALEQRREKTLALKQAMMQELLTGRTRLV